jgi:hypothetical protein
MAKTPPCVGMSIRACPNQSIIGMLRMPRTIHANVAHWRFPLDADVRLVAVTSRWQRLSSWRGRCRIRFHRMSYSGLPWPMGAPMRSAKDRPPGMRRSIMVGFIRTRSLFAHPSLIVREFGMQCFARCIWRTLISGRNVTFLECIPFAAPGHSAATSEPTGALVANEVGCLSWQIHGEDASPAGQVAHVNLAAVRSDALSAN